MFSFVDGKPSNMKFTKWIKKKIQMALLGGKVFRRLKIFVLSLFIILIALTIGSFIINFINPGIAKWIGVGAAFALVALTVIILFFKSRFKQFAKDGFGFNEGKVFHDWIRQTISNFHVQADPLRSKIKNFGDFSLHYMRVPDLFVNADPNRNNNNPPNMPMLTLIACDITAGRKIEFTQMWDLYWAKDTDVHPGDFVRASMSIPIFFETFTLSGIREKSTFTIWDKHLNWQYEGKDIPDTVQFIDGGTLSNFPINVFYNPQYPVPRMPTLGIRLQDGTIDPAAKEKGGLFQ
jgi:NTE family protein